MTVDVQDHQRLTADLVAELTDGLRETITAAVDYIQEKTVERGPKLSGWFRGSVTPYVGTPGDRDPGRDQPFYPVLGAADVDRAMEMWKPGVEAGVYSNAAHANRLAHGWSTQAADGWTDVIAEEASRL